ncbi:hypothetical protein [Paractinoplanes lichenicola]|uniref:Uncharacterized protein n=1 Tax=Paractinoplanes lichenicola TaxID=2802976 RepID=A0ABS1VXJ3_9ACTN|nr:hypothetical protein [Actinoplanes lichenicola]MBL7259211.1 hypothetical protein [Actinoplanes lichenicola]
MPNAGNPLTPDAGDGLMADAGDGLTGDSGNGLVPGAGNGRPVSPMIPGGAGGPMASGWLLVAYPKDYRRRHGEELLEPMLAEGRRPSVREIANLIVHGLRTRLGRPASRTVVGWAVLATVVAGVLGAAAGSWVGWWSAAPLPSAAETRALLADVAPESDVGPVEPALSSPFAFEGRELRWADADDLLLGRGGEYRPATAGGSGGLPGDADLDRLATHAGARLAAAGWAVRAPTRTEVDGCGAEVCYPWVSFRAARDGLALTLDLNPASFDQEPSVSVTVERTMPAGAWAGGAIGGLAAAVGAFLVFGWASRRTGRPDHPARLAVVLPFGVGVLLWLLPMPASISAVASSRDLWPSAAGPQLWEWIGQPAYLLLWLVGAGFVALSVLLAALPHSPELLRAAKASHAGRR